MKMEILTLVAAFVTTATFAMDESIRFLPDDAAAEDYFGDAVAIEGDWIVISSTMDDEKSEDSGSAYVFDATTGNQLRKLMPDNDLYRGYFGTSIAIEGDYAVIGAPQSHWTFPGTGKAFVFDLKTGDQLRELSADDAATEDWFGSALALDGDRVLVGAPYDDDNGSDSGSVYVFDFNTGEQLLKLLPTDGASNDLFGGAIALAGNLAIIGAQGDSDNGDNTGSAYVFDISTGEQLRKILPAEAEYKDRVGTSVALSGNLALIGAPKILTAARIRGLPMFMM